MIETKGQIAGRLVGRGISDERVARCAGCSTGYVRNIRQQLGIGAPRRSGRVTAPSVPHTEPQREPE